MFTEPYRAEYKALFQRQSNYPPNFEIVIGAYKFKVHREVVSSRSAFFRNTSDDWQNASGVTLVGDCPWTVAWLILWLYLGDNTSVFVNANVSELMGPENKKAKNHQTLLRIDGTRKQWEKIVLICQESKKYGIPDLYETAKSALSKHLFDDQKNLGAMVTFVGLPMTDSNEDICRFILDHIMRTCTRVQDFNKTMSDEFGSDALVIKWAQETVQEEFEARTKMLQQYREAVGSRNDFRMKKAFKDSARFSKLPALEKN